MAEKKTRRPAKKQVNKTDRTDRRTRLKGSETNYRPERSSQLSANERIVNRKREREKKRKRKKIIMRTVLSAIVIIIAITVSLLVFFHVNTITVSGAPIYSESEVIARSGIKLGDNLVFVSEKEANEKLTMSLPYIDSIEIKRHLPSTIEIIVKETKAVFAVVSDKGTYTLLDCKGKVLEKDLEFLAENIMLIDLGKIKSLEVGKTVECERENTVERMTELYSAMTEAELTGISNVDISDAYNTTLVYQGRITLLLGETTSSNIVDKLSLGKSAIDTQNNESSQYRGTLNLTVDKKGYWSEEVSTTEASTEETESEENGEKSENKDAGEQAQEEGKQETTTEANAEG
ncbi:MAG: FtsQ-type POTRA domain-containing protein [Clostridiales bacterium]|nr:FtsQ-type POTRA domain-containing protein [Clostridiales bacterium]